MTCIHILLWLLSFRISSLSLYLIYYCLVVGGLDQWAIPISISMCIYLRIDTMLTELKASQCHTIVEEEGRREAAAAYHGGTGGSDPTSLEECCVVHHGDHVRPHQGPDLRRSARPWHGPGLRCRAPHIAR